MLAGALPGDAYVAPVGAPIPTILLDGNAIYTKANRELTRTQIARDTRHVDNIGSGW